MNEYLKAIYEGVLANHKFLIELEKRIMAIEEHIVMPPITLTNKLLQSETASDSKSVADL